MQRVINECRAVETNIFNSKDMSCLFAVNMIILKPLQDQRRWRRRWWHYSLKFELISTQHAGLTKSDINFSRKEIVLKGGMPGIIHFYE